WEKFNAPVPPAAGPLSLTGLGALAINLFCALLLARYRAHRGSLTRAAFLSPRNDALANIAIIFSWGDNCLLPIAVARPNRRPRHIRDESGCIARGLRGGTSRAPRGVGRTVGLCQPRWGAETSPATAAFRDRAAWPAHRDRIDFRDGSVI